MARVIPSEVKGVIDTDLPDRTIKVFIGTANRMVTNILGTDTTLAAADLKDVELWLTAHYIAMGPERQAVEEEAKDASIKYVGKSGKGLDETSYGRMVKTIDTTGKMASSIGMKRATMDAIASFD